jgi:hypothetical protein
MAELLREQKVFEPLKSNRWVVKMGGVTQEIPEYLFKDFRLTTVFVKDEKYRGKKPKLKKALKLDLTHYNTVHFLARPEDIMECTKIKIEFLDPTGVCVNYYDMVVELESYEMIGDYSVDDLLANKCSFWVKDIESVVDKDIEKRTFENYKKKKEEA